MRHIISQNPQIGRETSEFQRMQIKRKNNEHMIGDTDNIYSFFTSTDGSQSSSGPKSSMGCSVDHLFFKGGDSVCHRSDLFYFSKILHLNITP